MTIRLVEKDCARPGCVEPRRSNVAYCRQHWNEYQNAYRRRRYRDEPEYRKKALADQRRKNYGISDEQYRAMLDEQKGVCAICASSPGKRALHVDHDHETGAVRGLLCHGCNLALGGFQEDRELLQNALDYLAQYDN